MLWQNEAKQVGTLITYHNIKLPHEKSSQKKETVSPYYKFASRKTPPTTTRTGEHRNKYFECSLWGLERSQTDSIYAQGYILLIQCIRSPDKRILLTCNEFNTADWGRLGR